MVSAQQRRQFAKDRAWLRGRGDGDPILLHLNGTFDEEKEQIGSLALLDDYLSRFKTPHLAVVNKFQDRSHDNARSSENETHSGGEARCFPPPRRPSSSAFVVGCYH